ncbi:hypothetical protein GGF42_008600, partial [Coemansia sp. RSA 2424]
MSLLSAETTLEELESRHKRESKELLARTTALKKTVSKGDKRKKKEVTAEITALESQLSERHAAEIKQLTDSCVESAAPANSSNAASDLAASDCESSSGPASAGLYGASGSLDRRLGGKVNKAKQRLQRRAEELQRIQAEAEKEAEGMVDVAAMETSAIDGL